MDRLRQQITFEAARLIHQRQEADFARAKVRAARRLCRQRLRPSQLPTNAEIREELKRLSGVYAVECLPDGDRAADQVADDERFARFRSLLVPLAKVRQDRRSHPEGDVLYHSLQVFALAREALPYDEEFLLAALLHDVGKGIDTQDHVAVGLAALGDAITERTSWLIENHSLARAILDGTIGIRARRRLQSSENYDELMRLAKCDREGRVPGAAVPGLDEALGYLRELIEGNE
jgi:hypothetical protein